MLGSTGLCGKFYLSISITTRAIVGQLHRFVYGVKPDPQQEKLESPVNTGGKVFAGLCRSEQNFISSGLCKCFKSISAPPVRHSWVSRAATRFRRLARAL